MSDIQVKMEVVVNRCFGGFGLSRLATKRLAERKGLKLREEGDYLFVGDDYDRIHEVVPRNDPDLIAIVREMGNEANGACAELAVVEVTVTVGVESYDGREKVRVYSNEW